MDQKWAHMSRTLKDRPYWVKLNDSTVTDHDHLNLGRTYYKTKIVLDKDGNEIYDETVWGFTATEIALAYTSDSSLNFIQAYNRRLKWYRFFSWNEDHPHISNAIIDQAKRLHNSGAGSNFLECGTYQKRRTEQVVYRQMKDYCTEGERYTSKWDSRHSGELPCTPSWDGIRQNFWYSDMAGPKASIRREINGIHRRLERDTLNRMRDQWNSGWDVDDYDEDVDFTTSQPHNWGNWLS